MSGPIERAFARAAAARAATNNQTQSSCATASNSNANSVTLRLRVAVPQKNTQMKKRRRKHHVNTLNERYKATNWMIENSAFDAKCIASKCVSISRNVFREIRKLTYKRQADGGKTGRRLWH